MSERTAEMERHLKLLRGDQTPESRHRGAALPSDILAVIVGVEEPQEWSPRVHQEDTEPPHIKEEEDELEEADTNKFTFSPVSVKSEEDEEKPQSSQLHQIQSDQMETGVDGGEEAEPQMLYQPLSEDSSETEVSDGDWAESTEPTTGSNSLSVGNIDCKMVERSYSCSECGQRFGRKSHLNAHMRIHTGEKPFSCSFCGKGCAQKTDLKKHMRVHTGEKPYSCPFCRKCCSGKGDLTKHMRVHTGEKPFSCNVCGKSCAQKGSLKIHMRIHTGEKPFSCSVCGKCFTVTGHLKRHMKLHTGTDSQEAEPVDTELACDQKEVDTS